MSGMIYIGQRTDFSVEPGSTPGAADVVRSLRARRVEAGDIVVRPPPLWFTPKTAQGGFTLTAGAGLLSGLPPSNWTSQTVWGSGVRWALVEEVTMTWANDATAGDYISDYDCTCVIASAALIIPDWWGRPASYDGVTPETGLNVTLLAYRDPSSGRFAIGEKLMATKPANPDIFIAARFPYSPLIDNPSSPLPSGYTLDPTVYKWYYSEKEIAQDPDL